MADAMQIARQYQAILGRAPTPDEVQYWGTHLDDGSLQGNEIGQILQSLPEFQQAQLERNTTQFGEKLNAQNGAILDQAGAAANSRFASLGRPNTSAMGASVLRAGGQLAQSRQSALADFYSNGLKANANLAARSGENALQNSYGIQAEQRQRKYQLSDYYQQKNDYEDAKNAHSGWNAITPEFVASGLFSVGGKAAAAYAGGA